MGDFAKLRDSWEKEPFVTTDNGDLSAVFGVQVVEELILSPWLPVSAIRLIKSGVLLPARSYSRSRERDHVGGAPLVNGASVVQAIADGNTLVIDELKTYCPPMANLARDLSAATGFVADCGAFVTPSGSRGLPPHYDLVNGLIRQVHGSKHWRVCEPIESFPTRAWDATRHRETRTVLDVVLHPGDCLYVPRGWTHVGEATDEASIHFTVGLRPKTWASVLRAMLDEVLTAEEYRESLPYAFHLLAPEELQPLLSKVTESAASELIQLVRESGGRGISLAEGPPGPEAPTPRGMGRLLLALSGQNAGT